MKYRIIRENGVIFKKLYYPQYSDDGQTWRYFMDYDGMNTICYRSLERAKDFIEEERKKDKVDVVWESEA